MNINTEDIERVMVTFNGHGYSLSLTGKGKIFYERYFGKKRAKITPQSAQNIISTILSKGVLFMDDNYYVNWSELGYRVDTPNQYTISIKFQGVTKSVSYEFWEGYYPVELNEVEDLMDELYRLAESQQPSASS